MEAKEAIVEASKKLGYHPLKEEQSLCISKFVEGRDVFCVLPTGFGKTACFACLPYVYDLINPSCEEKKSIVVVISPQIALIKDHVDSLKKRNVDVGYLNADSTSDVKSSVSRGKFSLVFESRNVAWEMEKSLCE